MEKWKIAFILVISGVVAQKPSLIGSQVKWVWIPESSDSPPQNLNPHPMRGANRPNSNPEDKMESQNQVSEAEVKNAWPRVEDSNLQQKIQRQWSRTRNGWSGFENSNKWSRSESPNQQDSTVEGPNKWSSADNLNPQQEIDSSWTRIEDPNQWSRVESQQQWSQKQLQEPWSRSENPNVQGPAEQSENQHAESRQFWSPRNQEVQNQLSQSETPKDRSEPPNDWSRSEQNSQNLRSDFENQNEWNQNFQPKVVERWDRQSENGQTSWNPNSQSKHQNPRNQLSDERNSWNQQFQNSRHQSQWDSNSQTKMEQQRRWNRNWQSSRPEMQSQWPKDENLNEPQDSRTQEFDAQSQNSWNNEDSQPSNPQMSTNWNDNRPQSNESENSEVDEPNQMPVQQRPKQTIIDNDKNEVEPENSNAHAIKYGEPLYEDSPNPRSKPRPVNFRA